MPATRIELLQAMPIFGAIREDTTSTGGTKLVPPYDSGYLEDGIGVKPGNSVQPAFAYSGVDPGTPEASVTLVFG